MTTTTRVNGNVGLLNKLNGNYIEDRSTQDFLDEEQFPGEYFYYYLIEDLNAFNK